jgi:spore coat protein U-like protein
MKRIGFTLLLALALCTDRGAHAASCALSSVSPVEFGGYSGNSIRVTGSVTFQCTQGTAYSISLSSGSGPSATINNRSMSGGADALAYQLYSDAGYNLVWGDTPGVSTVSGTATGSAQTVLIYALLPTGQYADAGAYMDSVTATISGNFMPSSLPLGVHAMVIKACTVTATPLEFGTYSGVAKTSVATVSATCTKGTGYFIGLDNGAGGSATSRRAMTGPVSARLTYDLFTDPGHTLLWGNTPGVDTAAATGSGTSQPFAVYGLVHGGQTGVPAGSYADLITITLTY